MCVCIYIYIVCTQALCSEFVGPAGCQGGTRKPDARTGLYHHLTFTGTHRRFVRNPPEP